MKAFGVTIFATILSSTLMMPAMAATPDAKAGKAVAQRCATCHGLDGIAHPPTIGSLPQLVPNLAGQRESYLVAQLQAFKDGSRSSPKEVMGNMTHELSDRDIADVAAYYSGLERCGR